MRLKGGVTLVLYKPERKKKGKKETELVIRAFNEGRAGRYNVLVPH